jgi:hypothetical protein
MRAPACLALLVLVAAPASADVFVLANKEKVDGYLLGRGTGAGKEYLIQTAAGVRKYNEATVKEILPSADPEADFKRYFAALPKKDDAAIAAAASALGAWAKERGLPDRAREAWMKALVHRPDLASAHEGLGHVKFGDQWMPPEEAARRRAEEEERNALASKYEKPLGARPAVSFTAHWRCVDFLGDGKTPDRLKDMEAAWDEAVRVFGSDPWRGRGLLIACAGLEQYVKWVDSEGASLPGARKGFTDFWRKATGMKYAEPPILVRSDAPDRGAMHAAFLHSAGHILLANWNGHNRNQPFWLEEGFGGWMEDAILKSNTSYCFGVSKQGYGSSFRDTKAWEVEFPDWKTLCREAASKNEFLPLDQLDMLPAGEYSRREVGQAFSLVAFLLKEKGPEKFRAYVLRVKKGEKSAAAFKAEFDHTLESIEPEWRRFVQAGW